MSSLENLTTSDGFDLVQLGPKTRQIPVQWDVRKLGTIANVNMGSSPKSEYYNEQGDGLPFFQGNADFGPQHPQVTVWCTNPNKTAEKEDLLLSVRAPVGDLNTADQHCCIGRGLAAISGEEADNSFLYYLLSFERPRLETYAQGSTFQSVNFGVLNNFPVQFPPLPEQRRIADILSTVDKQIKQTDEIIESTEELRRGLMNEFFHTGYDQHSTTTKGTLGEAPTDWDVCPLSDVADVEMGSSPKSEYYNTTGDGLPFFQANNEFGYRLPTHDRWCSEPKKIAEEGDTLVTIRGTYVGQVNVAPERCCIGRGLAAVSATDVDQEYLYHQLAHREEYVKSIASGSTFDSINSTELRSLSVQVPPFDEQEKIASCLRNLQRKYAEEIEYKETLQDLKRGLMQDLLTGKVRVNPTQSE